MRWFFFREHNGLVEEFKIINAIDAQNIKQKIDTLALCTHQKPNQIHSQLKKKYNYYSYRLINHYTFELLNEYLDSSLAACNH